MDREKDLAEGKGVLRDLLIGHEKAGAEKELV